MNAPQIRSMSATTTIKEVLQAKKERKAVSIYNNGSVTVYLLSGDKQTTTDGYPVFAGREWHREHFDAQGRYLVLAESGTCDLRIEEVLKDPNTPNEERD